MLNPPDLSGEPELFFINTRLTKQNNPSNHKDLKGYLRYVVPGGFEPPLTEPKTVVLPLHHRTIKPTAKVVDFFSTTKYF